MTKELINKYALKYGIDPDLMTAICTVESSMNPYVVRYEPVYKWTYHCDDYAHKLKITTITEETFQKTSWGLSQIIGANFRTMGFDDYLTKTLDPEINLMYQAKFLKSLFQRFGSESDVISAYNQGGNYKNSGGTYRNSRYVDSVHNVLLKLRALE